MILRPFTVDSQPVSDTAHCNQSPFVRTWRVVTTGVRIMLVFRFHEFDHNTSCYLRRMDTARRSSVMRVPRLNWHRRRALWNEEEDYEEENHEDDESDEPAFREAHRMPLNEISMTLSEVISAATHDLLERLQTPSDAQKELLGSLEGVSGIGVEDPKSPSETRSKDLLNDSTPRTNCSNVFYHVLGYSCCTPSNILHVIQARLDEVAGKRQRHDFVRELVARADPRLGTSIDGDNLNFKFTTPEPVMFDSSGLSIDWYWNSVRDAVIHGAVRNMLCREESHGAFGPTRASILLRHGDVEQRFQPSVIECSFRELAATLEDTDEYRLLSILNMSAKGGALEVLEMGPAPEDDFQACPQLPDEVVEDLSIDGKTVRICIE